MTTTPSIPVTYVGEPGLAPEETVPFSVRGMAPFQAGETRDFTEDSVREFGASNLDDFVEFNFGANGVYNANLRIPRFVIGQATTENTTPSATTDHPDVSPDTSVQGAS